MTILLFFFFVCSEHGFILGFEIPHGFFDLVFKSPCWRVSAFLSHSG